MLKDYVCEFVRQIAITSGFACLNGIHYRHDSAARKAQGGGAKTSRLELFEPLKL